MEIGHIAKLLGISNQGVRYLEDEGIVHPHRDESSGYRQYTVEDQSALYMYKLYRLAGMQLGDIKEALRSDPLGSIRAVRKNIARLREELLVLERRSDEVEEFLMRGLSTPSFSIERRPHLYCLLQPRNDDESGPSSKWSTKLSEVRGPLHDEMPSVFFGIYACLLADGETLATERCMITERDVFDSAAQQGLGVLRELPERDDCLHAVLEFTSDDEDASYFDEPLRRLASDGLTYDGSPLAARFLHLQQTDGPLVYRVEIWVPFVR